jgi:hypothetical protein
MASKAAIEPRDEVLAGTVAITPRDYTASSFRAVFDFNPTLHLAPRLTFQAIRRNDSEVFTIIAFRTVKDLIRAIELGDASLADRDEEGRSLLNVS